MNNILAFLLPLFLLTESFAHNNLSGKVFHALTKEPLSDVMVQLIQKQKFTFTDAYGNFTFEGVSNGTYLIQTTSLGYQTRTDTVVVSGENKGFISVFLLESKITLTDVEIVARKENSTQPISSVDFRLRPHLTTQDLLRLVPGLFISQHAGGGKAEALLLRGFDVDHGTDVAISIDDMPVNMVSHCHGQGYADLHFIIPETIEKMNFSKGPYESRLGDFNTAGAVKFQTIKTLPSHSIKIEAGRFNTIRGVAMMNLLHNTDSNGRKQNAYAAAEFAYTNGFFKHPQDFSRINVFAKYTNELFTDTHLSLTLSSFSSRWNASGEIPERGVASGLIHKYGSVDPSEGGNTMRHNANLTLHKKLDDHSSIQTNLYYIIYSYNLFSNFTFFKNDSVNGDAINQYEDRGTFGYNAAYTRVNQIKNTDIRSTIGIGLRYDDIANIGLSHVRNRNFLKHVSLGEIQEISHNIFIDENLYFTPRLSLNVGIRYDGFGFSYRDDMVDTADNFKTARAGILSPKFNLYYNLTNKFQIYFNAGSGFHSNDARVAVETGRQSLPRAISTDLGTNFKAGKRLFINGALWYMTLASEYVWVGDEGIFEPGGKTKRIGIDFSARYQITSWLFADGDINVAHPKYVNEPRERNYVALAPPITSIAGLNIKTNHGFSASLRYRYLGERPLMEDNSIRISSYFILDAVVGYSNKQIQVGLTAENLLNKYWEEASHATESRLKSEPFPVTDIHYTPGVPFNLRGYITFLF